MSMTSRADLEEERRLFYVALTRAEKKATLSYALTRYRWGNLIDCEPSRFIEEIDDKYLDANFINVKPAINPIKNKVIQSITKLIYHPVLINIVIKKSIQY